MTIRFNPYFLIYSVVIGIPLLYTITYLLAAMGNHVPWCNPLFSNCTTLTATGIYVPESYVMRFGLTPLITAMGIGFFFFKEHLIRFGVEPKHANKSYRIAVVGCIGGVAAVAFMQGPEETDMGLHTLSAVIFFVLMLVAQFTFTQQDNTCRREEIATAYWVRVVACAVQTLLLTYSAYIFFSTGKSPGMQYEWWLTITIIVWYSSFLFESNRAFIDGFLDAKRD
ncbi:MAG: hypothetical protein ACI93R_000058 [Flavobacteriales bacterium]|jgi:hypothetical protein